MESADPADPTRTKPFPLGAILQPSVVAPTRMCHRENDNWLPTIFLKHLYLAV